MNKQLLIGFGVVLAVIVLGVPVLSQVKKESGGGSSAQSSSGPAPAVGSVPPALNASNLSGTVWEVKVQGFPIQVTLNAGGSAVAHTDSFIVKKMAGTDTLHGNWSVNGAKVTATIQIKDKTESINIDIIGDKLYYDGQEIKRIR